MSSKDSDYVDQLIFQLITKPVGFIDSLKGKPELEPFIEDLKGNENLKIVLSKCIRPECSNPPIFSHLVSKAQLSKIKSSGGTVFKSKAIEIEGNSAVSSKMRIEKKEEKIGSCGLYLFCEQCDKFFTGHDTSSLAASVSIDSPDIFEKYTNYIITEKGRWCINSVRPHLVRENNIEIFYFFAKNAYRLHFANYKAELIRTAVFNSLKKLSVAEIAEVWHGYIENLAEAAIAQSTVSADLKKALMYEKIFKLSPSLLISSKSSFIMYPLSTQDFCAKNPTGLGGLLIDLRAIDLHKLKTVAANVKSIENFLVESNEIFADNNSPTIFHLSWIDSNRVSHCFFAPVLLEDQSQWTDLSLNTLQKNSTFFENMAKNSFYSWATTAGPVFSYYVNNEFYDVNQTVLTNIHDACIKGVAGGPRMIRAYLNDPEVLSFLK